VKSPLKIPPCPVRWKRILLPSSLSPLVCGRSKLRAPIVVDLSSFSPVPFPELFSDFFGRPCCHLNPLVHEVAFSSSCETAPASSEIPNLIRIGKTPAFSRQTDRIYRLITLMCRISPAGLVPLHGFSTSGNGDVGFFSCAVFTQLGVLTPLSPSPLST